MLQTKAMEKVIIEMNDVLEIKGGLEQQCFKYIIVKQA